MILASLAKGVQAMSLSPSTVGDTDALGRLGAVRDMLAEVNGGRKNYTAVLPHHTADAAVQTERDVAQLLEEAMRDGYTPRRPANWDGAAAAASELTAYVHGSRGDSSRSGSFSAADIKRHCTTLSIAPATDSEGAQRKRDGAVAPQVVEKLGMDSRVLAEVKAERAGQRDGATDPLGVARTMVRAHGQAMGALLMSNLSAQAELRGPGIVGTGPTAYRNVHAWLKNTIRRVLGKFKMDETKVKAEVETLAAAIQMGALDKPRLQIAVRLLGGKPRQKRWTASDANTARGSWGSPEVLDDWRRTMRNLARIMAQFYGGVLQMPTGISTGDDLESAFGLADLVDGGPEHRDLTLERAVETFELIFAGFATDCEDYRSELGVALPDLSAHTAQVYATVVGDMEQAELNYQQVKADNAAMRDELRQEVKLEVRQDVEDLLSAAGIKRNAAGKPLNFAGTPTKPSAPSLKGTPSVPAEHGQGKSRQALQRQKKAAAKLAGEVVPAAAGGGKSGGTPAVVAAATGATGTAGTSKLVASGQGFQLFAPEQQLDTDMAVVRAWGMAYHAGGTSPEEEPCGWKSCFGKCVPKGGKPCSRDHNKAAPPELKAALKAYASPAEAKRFTA